MKSINFDYVNRVMSIQFVDYTMFLTVEDSHVIEKSIASDRVISQARHSCCYAAIAGTSLDTDDRKDRLIKKAVIAFDDFFSLHY
jgi:hypothetical protein